MEKSQVNDDPRPAPFSLQLYWTKQDKLKHSHNQN